eukprot:1109376-Rhodomonas_salina.1
MCMHAHPKGRNCYCGTESAAAAVVITAGYLKADGHADLDHPEVRVLLRNPQPFSLTDPKVIDGYVSWGGIWCPDCMVTSRTPLVKNLFGKRREQESSSSDSEPEAEAAEDPESETPQVVPLIDLSSPEPEEAGGRTGAGGDKLAGEGLVLCRLPGCHRPAFVDPGTGKES